MTSIRHTALCMAPALLLVLSACDMGERSAPPPTLDDFKKIQADMSESQVIEILGEPLEAEQHFAYQNLRFLHWAEHTFVALDMGKVYAVSYEGQSLLLVEEEQSWPTGH